MSVASSRPCFLALLFLSSVMLGVVGCEEQPRTGEEAHDQAEHGAPADAHDGHEGMQHEGMQHEGMQHEGMQHGHEQHQHEEMVGGEPLPGASIYHLPGTWQTAEGESLELSQLRGQPVILAMIYTTCEQVCPIIVEHMKEIEAELGPEDRNEVRFVLASIDPERDSVEAMQAYARKRKLDPDRWTLLRGAPERIRELAATLGVRYKQLPDQSFSHSNTITLLDRGGEVVDQRKRLDEPLEPLVASLQRQLE